MRAGKRKESPVKNGAAVDAPLAGQGRERQGRKAGDKAALRTDPSLWSGHSKLSVRSLQAFEEGAIY